MTYVSITKKEIDYLSKFDYMPIGAHGSSSRGSISSHTCSCHRNNRYTIVNDISNKDHNYGNNNMPYQCQYQFQKQCFDNNNNVMLMMIALRFVLMAVLESRFGRDHS